jgi:pilus assembly protein Flp/PilA
VARTKIPKRERERLKMKDKLLKLSVKLQLLKDENGQDLIEYALMVALISLAATIGMKNLATSMNLAFTHIGTKLSTYTT